MRPILHKNLWFGYTALAILLLLAWLITAHLHNTSTDVIFTDQQQPSSPSTKKVEINKASVYALRKAGFSYYEVSQIMYQRSQGHYFLSPTDLAKIPYIDSLRLAKIASSLAFNLPKQHSAPSFQPFQQSHSRRITLFNADSLQMLSLGMSPAAWDTLARFQRSSVLRGSAPADSLVQLSPAALSAFLTSRATPRYNNKQSAQQPEPAHYDIIIELNSATPEQLAQIPYIKEKSAQQILDYRDKLGGFVSPLQLLEIWNIDSARLEKILPHISIDSTTIRHININSTNDTRLRRHPYFSSRLANRLFQIRQRKGRNKKLSPADLQQALQGETPSPFFWHYVSYAPN